MQSGSGETTVIAIYNNRSEAEVARGVLEDRGIQANVAADDVHVPMQMTEGARLFVMADDVDEAREVLAAADMLPQPDPAGSNDDEGSRGEHALAYVVIFILVILAVLAGVFLSP